MKRARKRLGLLLVVGMLTTVLPLGAIAPVSAASPGDLVINEVMQNPSAVFDSDGEWFELYNPTAADVDIDGWTIADNDSDSFVVVGSVIVPAGGYAVLGVNGDTVTNGGVSVDYEYSGMALANGADEVILFDGLGVEIDRIEYDGGTVWPDPNGASMALRDPALDNNDGVNWCEAVTPYGDGDLGTPGAANDCAAPPAAELVINEVMQNPSAVFDSDGEWFELYNPTAADVDIDGWTIADNDSDSFVVVGSVIVPAGGYAVLGVNGDTVTNGGVSVDYEYSGMALANGADEVILFDGLGVEIDRIEYDGGTVWPDPNGASMALRDPALDNNDGVNWCEAVTPYGDGDLGTPGAANDCAAPPAAELVINEVMQNPSAVFDSDGEWFELYNPTAADVDIDGWTIADNDSDSFVVVGSVIVPAGGYAVLGVNGDTVTNGGVSVDYEYSGMALANGADEVILFDGLGVEIDRIEYDGGTVWPDPNGASMALRDPALDNNDGVNWCEAVTPYGDGDLGTPGAANICAITKIHEIQGSGATSPLVGQQVAVEGIVVGDFQDDLAGTSGDLNGYFVQEEEGDYDGDPATSEGIFVFDPTTVTDVAVGDLVRITGTVSEYVTSGGSSETQLGFVGPVTTLSSGNALPAVTEVALPYADVSDLEAYEGMYVAFGSSQPLYIAEYFNYDRFGEMVITTDPRPAQPTAVFEPGSTEAAELADLNARSRITLDDGRTNQNPVPARHPDGSDFSTTNSFRGGDRLTDVIGGLGESFGLYRIQPTVGAAYTPLNPRTATPDDVGGSLQVASFNVLNYFTTIDTGAPDCGPSGGLDCRGADSEEELVRQRTKIIAALAAIDADIVGLIEIENHPATTLDEPLDDLVTGLNEAVGAGTYDYVATGSIGTDAIKVALIYKPASVSLNGGYSILDSTVDPLFDDDRNRPRPRPDVHRERHRRSDDGGRQPPEVEGLRLRPGRRRSRARQLQPDSDQRGNCARRLARRSRVRVRRGRAGHRRSQLVRQGGSDRRPHGRRLQRPGA